MTAAVYIPELYVERAYRLPSIDPSSTRAEIFAIAAALSELTPHSRATIHSDSQAAIAAITAIMTITPWTYTRFHRIKNSAILQYIWATLRQFNVAIELKWVRGHSDSEENNRADWLATSAYTLHTVTDIPPGNVSCLMHDGTRSEMPTKSILGLLQHGKTNFDLMNTSAISRALSAHGDIQLKASWVATVIGQGKSGPLDASHVAETAFRIKDKLGILKPPKGDTCHQCDGPYTPNHMLTCQYGPSLHEIHVAFRDLLRDRYKRAEYNSSPYQDILLHALAMNTDFKTSALAGGWISQSIQDNLTLLRPFDHIHKQTLSLAKFLQEILDTWLSVKHGFWKDFCGRFRQVGLPNAARTRRPIAPRTEPRPRKRKRAAQRPRNNLVAKETALYDAIMKGRTQTGICLPNTNMSTELIL